MNEQTRNKMVSDSEVTIPVYDTLPIMLQIAAIDAIEKLLNRVTPPQLPFQGPREVAEDGQLMFSEQVRGILTLLHEVERRYCRIEDDEEPEE